MNEQVSLAHEYELRPLWYIAGALMLVAAISLVLSLRDNKKDNSIPTETASTPFPAVSIQAKAAYVYDIKTGQVLFSQNEDKRLPLASITKVMSALVAKQIGLKHNTVVVSADALEAEGDSGLLRDEKWFLEDSLNFSLITSSNDGVRAAALALGALSNSDASRDEIINDFVRMMNEKASELGLKNTYFWNETGLDESEIKGGAYGSASDVTRLMAHIFQNSPGIFSLTKEPVATFTSLDEKIHTARNTNDIISDIPGLLASKTGYTATAGGNLTIIFDPEIGHPVAITVLGSTEDGRFSDVRALVNATLEHLSTR